MCDALIHLNRVPNATIEKLVSLVPGPDFPTGGVLVESAESIVETYRTGRGGFRVRARWEVERLSHGMYQVVVTEIPYQVPKARLIEKAAELLAARKLPLLNDIRDESTDDVRIVLEPRNRSVDPALLMEQLFRLTDLEVRIGLNLNVLDGGVTPRGDESAGGACRPFSIIGTRFSNDVLAFRLEKIGRRRFEVLGGLLVAYLNLDEVIRIIREEDEPKAVPDVGLRPDRRPGRSDPQHAPAKPAQARGGGYPQGGRRTVRAEQADLESLLGDEKRRRRRWSASNSKALKKTFAPDTALGRRRTEIGTAPINVDVPIPRP